MIRWFASIPVSDIAEAFVFPGLALSISQQGYWADWGHLALLLATIPVVAWAFSNWWVDLT
jgi:hypothetical protein